MRSDGELLEKISLVIPVKRFAMAKTRLSVDGAIRRAAAESLLLSTLQVATSCLESSQIYVLTADEVATRHAHQHGVSVLPDTATDLNTALHAAVAELKQREHEAIVVVLVADLPRLHSSDLWHALTRAAVSSAPRHVADHHGTGTTFVSIPPRTDLPMVFGGGSAQRFTVLGSIPLRDAPQGLCTDLDTPNDPFQLSLAGV